MAWRLLPGLQLYREGLEAPRHTVTRCWRATLGSAKAKLNYYRPVVRLSLYIGLSRNLCSVLYVGHNTRVEPLCWTSLVCVKKISQHSHHQPVLSAWAPVEGPAKNIKNDFQLNLAGTSVRPWPLAHRIWQNLSLNNLLWTLPHPVGCFWPSILRYVCAILQ